MSSPIQIDRVFLDILDWIRSVLWYREKRVTFKPYNQVYRRLSPYGTLFLVERNSVRAIRTFVFTPKSTNKSDFPDDLDLHIYLDHLFPVAGEKTQKHFTPQGWRATHTLTILLASRKVDPSNGTYSLLPLFSQQYAMQKDQHPHLAAIQICDRLALRLLNRHLNAMIWEIDIKEIGFKVLGSNWVVNNPRLPEDRLKAISDDIDRQQGRL